MLKSFIGLWLVVFGPLFFLLYPSDINPIIRFNEHIEGKRLTTIYQGTLQRIENTLEKSAENTWQAQINTLATHFSYDIKLITREQLAHDLKLQNRKIQALNADEIVFINAEPEYLLKAMKNSHYVLQLFTDFSAHTKIKSGAAGSVYIIQRAFAETPRATWPNVIQRLSQQFPYRLHFQSLTEKHSFTAEEINTLKAKDFFWRGNNEKNITFYIPLYIKENGVEKDANTLLIAESIPMTSISLSVVLLLAGIFIVAVSLGMFLWVYPLWRDIQQLAHTTSSFGRGKLDQRARLSRISTVATLSNTFNRMADQIQALLNNQKTLTHAIAHDLRTPLHRLRFATECLKDHTENNTTKQKDSEKYWQAVEKSMSDVDNLITHILELSRYSSEKNPSTFSQTNIAELIQHEYQHTQPLHPHIIIHYQSTLTPAQETSKIDKQAMERAVGNVLNNALKFAKQNIQIQLSFSEKNQQYCLRIEDDGIGISDENKTRIFQPFEQITPAQKTHPKNTGYGLGLAIVQHIVHWHNGTVHVGNSPLGGAAFYVCWPRKT